MATYTCPEGHSSTAGDYCDVCGAPIAAATPPPLPGASGGAGASSLDLGGPSADAASAGPSSTVSGKTCPNCQAVNLTAALFCESCGYDFTTGQLPRPLDPPGATDTPAAGPTPDGTPADASPADPGPDAAVQPPPSTPAVPDLPASAVKPSAVEWVVEVWVDPDWYAAQDVTDPCPSAGMPAVVPLTSRNVLIGRTSSSRNIHPEVDISTDTGVSRRHCQLTGDGLRWWVEDLQSANGTYVGTAGAAIPTDPIPAGQRVELTDDGRVYVGAWTRLVVRKASPSEQVPLT